MIECIFSPVSDGVILRQSLFGLWISSLSLTRIYFHLRWADSSHSQSCMKDISILPSYHTSIQGNVGICELTEHTEF